MRLNEQEEASCIHQEEEWSKMKNDKKKKFAKKILDEDPEFNSIKSQKIRKERINEYVRNRNYGKNQIYAMERKKDRVD